MTLLDTTHAAGEKDRRRRSVCILSAIAPTPTVIQSMTNHKTVFFYIHHQLIVFVRKERNRPPEIDIKRNMNCIKKSITSVDWWREKKYSL